MEARSAILFLAAAIAAGASYSAGCELVVGPGNYSSPGTSSGDDGGDDAGGENGASSGGSSGGGSSASGSSSGHSASSGSSSAGSSASGSGATSSGGSSGTGGSSGSNGSSGAGASSGGSGSSSASGGRPGSSGSSGSSSSSGAACTYPSGASCSVDPQCGCQSGEKCDIASSAAAACTTAGSGIQGTPCTANTDCAAGLSCAAGVCHTYCSSVGVACSGGGLCEQVGDGSQPQDKLCTIDCTLSPDSCGSGETCNPFVVNDTAVSGDCEAPGTVTYGNSCSTSLDCAMGLWCVPSYDLCLPWCQNDAFCESALGSSYACYFDYYYSVEGTEYGYCD